MENRESDAQVEMPNLFKWIFKILMIAMFLCILWLWISAPRGTGVANLKELETEFFKISPPDYAYKAGEKKAITKVSSALVEQFYLTRIAEIDIKAYYDKQLFKNGWIESTVKDSSEWSYCKGRLRADISPQRQPSGYNFSISWFNQNTSNCP